MFLSQCKYAQDILHRAHMSSCKPTCIPVDTKSKLSATSGKPLATIILSFNNARP